MKIVVVGSGGREHAICDTLVREGHEVIATPGNPGISRVATVTDLHPEALNADLFVVGPEAPLVDGLADRLRAENKITFGPGRDGAQLEGSKEFMKKLAAQAGVPTARFGSFSDSAPALAYLESMTAPYVIKTDGLAAGKGVLVTKDLALAKADVIAKLSGSSFGAAGRRVIIEEAMSGPEVSLMVLVDGKRALALQPATDHKRLYDGDGGPNTGGMGAYSPVGWFVDDQVCLAMDLIVNPVIARMIELGIDYRGILYAGLMVCESGPKLVEFNVRFGDPEAQVVVPALEGSLGELLYGAATGELPQGIARGTQAAAAVVMAAPGYPESPKTGGRIEGVDGFSDRSDLRIYHAGTRRASTGELLVGGGRVLSVTGFGDSIDAAIKKAYMGLSSIHFEGAQFRSDIGASSDPGLTNSSSLG